MITEKGPKGFLKWLKQDQPKLYAAIAPKLAQMVISAKKTNALSGFGDPLTDSLTADFTVDTSALTNLPALNIDTAASSAPASSSFSTVLQTLIQGAGAALLTKQQLDTAQKVTDIQLQRAQQGLAPLNTSALGLPGVGVNVGLSDSTSKLVMYGGLALLAVLLVPKLIGSRR